MDNFISETLIEDINNCVNNINQNKDNTSLLKYYAGKLSILSGKIITSLCNE